jgi:hypothetical protein
LDYLRHIGVAAASTGSVTYGTFLASVHREISVAVVKGNHGIFRAGVQLYTRASGPVYQAMLCPLLILSDLRCVAFASMQLIAAPFSSCAVAVLAAFLSM